MYSPVVTDHAINPRNRGILASATTKGSARYHRCGDKLTLYFEVKDGVVTACQFAGFACGPVIAAGSLLTTMAQGQPVDDVRNIDAFQLNKALGGLPASKRHAILLVLQCIHEALGGECDG